jgi:hypothetical protein
VWQGFFKPSIRWMILLKGDEYMNYTENFSVSKLHALVKSSNLAGKSFIKGLYPTLKDQYETFWMIPVKNALYWGVCSFFICL